MPPLPAARITREVMLALERFPRDAVKARTRNTLRSPPSPLAGEGWGGGCGTPLLGSERPPPPAPPHVVRMRAARDGEGRTTEPADRTESNPSAALTMLVQSRRDSPAVLILPFQVAARVGCIAVGVPAHAGPHPLGVRSSPNPSVSDFIEQEREGLGGPLPSGFGRQPICEASPRQ